MTEALLTAAGTSAASPSPVLAGKILALQRKHLAVAVLTGVAMALVVGVELAALAMFLDWWLDLPWAVRLVLLVGQLAVLGYLLLRQVVRPLTRQPDEDELALMVERAKPEFRSRLIASVQLVRPAALPAGASRALVDVLVAQTEALAAPLNFGDIVPTDRLRKFGITATCIVALAVAGFIAGGGTTADLARRVFLSSVPVPRKTRVQVPEGDRKVGLGDSVRLEALAQGIIPATGKLRLDYHGRRSQEFSLEQDKENRSRFGRTIENIQQTFTYRIHLNDGVSPTYTVKAVPRPMVAALQCEQEYPGYTGLKSVRRSLGDLSLLAGSKLKLAITATKPLQSGAIKVAGLTNAAAVPLTVNREDARQLSGQIQIPASGLNGFQVQMVDVEGMESRDSAVYRVEIIPDKAPVVRITYPDRKEELVTRRARLLLAFEAADDFLISRVRLRYKLTAPEGANANGSGSEGAVELDLVEEQPQRLRRRFEWRLGDLPLSEGSVMEYWVEVQDNNDATGPGIGLSDRQVARVVNENDKRADLLNRAGDYMGSIGDAASDQERLNRSLGAIILERTGPK